jgi:hypothetical protein
MSRNWKSDWDDFWRSFASNIPEPVRRAPGRAKNWSKAKFLLLYAWIKGVISNWSERHSETPSDPDPEPVKPEEQRFKLASEQLRFEANRLLSQYFPRNHATGKLDTGDMDLASWDALVQELESRWDGRQRFIDEKHQLKVPPMPRRISAEERQFGIAYVTVHWHIDRLLAQYFPRDDATGDIFVESIDHDSVNELASLMRAQWDGYPRKAAVPQSEPDPQPTPFDRFIQRI